MPPWWAAQHNPTMLPCGQHGTTLANRKPQLASTQPSTLRAATLVAEGSPSQVHTLGFCVASVAKVSLGPREKAGNRNKNHLALLYRRRMML
jgi:hypothetical protein